MGKTNTTILTLTQSQFFTVPAGVTAVEVEGYLRRFKILSSGAAHNLALLDNGDCYAWGLNANGQLGTGTVTPMSVPTLVLGGLKFIAVAASRGGNSSYGINEQGQIYAWGNNANGQLGQGDVVPKSSPVLVLNGANRRFKHISAGTAHACAIALSNTDGNNMAYSWGLNGNGQLGDSTVVPKSSPVIVLGAGREWKQVECGANHTVGITLDWFDNVNFVTVPGGDVLCWGLNTSGQLGDSTLLPRSTPTIVVGTQVYTRVGAGETASYGVKDVTASFGYLVNRVYSWGNNANGQLSDNTVVGKSSPVIVKDNSGFNFHPGGGIFEVFDIVGGTGHAALLSNGNSVYTWGLNANGQMGTNDVIARSYPVFVDGAGSFGNYHLSLGVGSAYTMFNTANMSIYGVGVNTNGQLGDSTVVPKSSPVIVSGTRTYALNKEIFKSRQVLTVVPGDTVQIGMANGIMTIVNSNGNYFSMLSDTQGIVKLTYRQ